MVNRCQYDMAKEFPENDSQLRRSIGSEDPWDIEDLVKVGVDKEFCPYYIAKGFERNAELILCPYNYIVDPTIRKAMQIDLQDQVIILDEAHNIEDIARDVVGGRFNLDIITETSLEWWRIYSNLKENEENLDEDLYRDLASFLARFECWIENNLEGIFFSAFDALSELKKDVFTPSSYKVL